MTTPRRHARIAVLLIAGWAVLGAAGCYRRVVSASGPGADDYQVSESYQESSKLDQWFWGDDGKQPKQNGTRLNQKR